jgi:PAS domain S-box-containing protein
MTFALIASAEPRIHAALRNTLPDGLVVLSADSGEEALTILAEKSVGILFCDANLPDYSGAELMRRIRDAHLTTPIIVLAPSPASALVREAREYGAHQVIWPPFDAEALNLVIDRALERNALLRRIQDLETKSIDISNRQRPEQGAAEVWSSGSVSLNRNLHYKQFALRELYKALTHISDLDRLLDYALKGLVEIFGVNKASIFVMDKQFSYRIRVQIGLDEALRDILLFKAHEGLPAWFLRHNRILRRDRCAGPDEFGALEAIDALQAVLSVPFVAHGKLLGILNLGNKVTGKPYTDDDEELLIMIANYMAVAVENSLLYREIALQKHYSENILENIISGVVAIDEKGIVTAYNRSAENILGVPSAEVLGRPVQRLGSVFSDLLLHTLVAQTVFHRHEVTDPQTKAPLGVSTSQLKDNGDVVGSIMVFTDLTQAKELEQKSRTVESLRFWINLANRLAQEIRNPLVAVRTFAQLLPERYQDEDFRNRFYEIVLSEIDRLHMITQKLMEFAQPRESRPEENDLNDLLNQTLLLFNEDRFLAGKIRVAKEFTSEPLTVRLDRSQIQRALANIIDNSLDAMPEGGRLLLRTSRAFKTAQDRPMALIHIQDTGEGIAVDHRQDLFLPFFTTKLQAMGFGLPIAQRVIQEHGGKIEVDSTLGRGATFTIYLPLARENADHPLQSA